MRKNARVERLWGCFQLKQIAATEAKLRGKQNKNWSKVASEPECWHWCRGCEHLLARAVSGGSFIPPCGGDGLSMGADAATIGGNKRFTPSTSSLQPWVIAPREPAPLPRCKQGYKHWEGGITDWEGSYALAAELTHPFPIRRNISHKYLMYKNWPWDLFFFFFVNAMRFDVLVYIVGSHGNNWMILCIIRIVHISQSQCLFSSQTNTNVCALTATRVPSTTHEWEMSWKSIFVLYLSACASFREVCTTDQSPEPHFVTSQWWYKATSN